MVTKYAIHPLVEVFQPYDAGRYETLRDSIKGYGGLRQPITIWRGAVIDGRHRYKACVELELEPWVVELNEYADPLDAVVNLNGVRRQMTTAQRALAAARIADMRHGGDRRSDGFQDANLHLENTYTQERAAKALGVSTRGVASGRAVLESGEDDVIAEIDAGNLSINKAQIRIAERQAAREREERAAAVRAEIAEQNERKRKERDERELFERERERLERESAALESAALESGEGAAVSLDIAAPDGGITIIIRLKPAWTRTRSRTAS